MDLEIYNSIILKKAPGMEHTPMTKKLKAPYL